MRWVTKTSSAPAPRYIALAHLQYLSLVDFLLLGPTFLATFATLEDGSIRQSVFILPDLNLYEVQLGFWLNKKLAETTSRECIHTSCFLSCVILTFQNPFPFHHLSWEVGQSHRIGPISTPPSACWWGIMPLFHSSACVWAQRSQRTLANWKIKPTYRPVELSN